MWTVNTSYLVLLLHSQDYVSLTTFGGLIPKTPGNPYETLSMQLYSAFKLNSGVITLVINWCLLVSRKQCCFRKNTRSNGILKADTILWVISLPAWRVTSTPIIFWLRHDHWPDTVWKSCIFLPTLWRSPSGRGVTTQLMGTSKEMWYLRTTSDSSPQLSFLWKSVLISETTPTC